MIHHEFNSLQLPKQMKTQLLNRKQIDETTLYTC